MSILNKLTLAQLKENKRRTFLTGLSITIIVSLLTAIVVFASGMRGMLTDNAIKGHGNWHFKTGVTTYTTQEDASREQKLIHELKNKLSSTNFVEQIIQLDYIPLQLKEEGVLRSFGEAYKLTPELYEAQKYYFGELSSGRLPEKEDEIVITTAMQYENSQYTYNLKENGAAQEKRKRYKLGDTFPLVIGETTYPLKIVGIIKKWEDKVLLSANNAIPSLPMLIGKHKQVKNDFFALMSSYDDAYDLVYNNSLLATYGVISSKYTGYSDAMKEINLIIFIVIIILSIVMTVIITSAFMLSLNERLKQLGALASIGTTRKQIRYMLLMEGFFIGSVAIVIGLIVGIIGIGVAIAVINNILDSLGEDINIPFIIDWKMLLLVVACVTVVIVLATLLPSLRATRRSAIDNIKQVPFVRYIQVKQKRMRTKRGLGAKLFGVPGHLAKCYKKFNSARSFMIFMILSVSLITFNSISNLLIELENTVTQTVQKGPKNIYTTNDIVYRSYVFQEYEPDALSVYNKAKELDNVTYRQYVQSKMSVALDEALSYPLDLSNLSPEAENVLLKEAGITKEQFKQKNVAIFVTNQQGIKDTKVEENKDFSYIARQYDETSKSYVSTNHQIRILKIVDIERLSFALNSVNSLIVSDNNFKELLENDGVSIITSLNVKKGTDESVYNTLSDSLELEPMSLVNTAYQVRTIQGFLQILQIIVYGFLSLVTLLCLTAIFNNMTANIQLRRREFAMLRSIGMTIKQIKAMLSIENLQAGITAISIAVLTSVAIHYAFYQAVIAGVKYAVIPDFSYPLLPTISSSVGLLIILILFNIFSIKQAVNRSLVEDIANETL